MLIPSALRTIKLPKAVHKGVTTKEDLILRIGTCTSEKFTGRLDFTAGNTQSLMSSLYFHLGALIGCTSQLHPVRRWCRQLSKHCLQQTNFSGSQPPQYWDYETLMQSVEQGKVLQAQMEAVLEGHLTEIVFDLYQQCESDYSRLGLQLTYREIAPDAIAPLPVSIRATPILQQTKKFWEAWQKAGLATISPNYAPVILKPEALQQQTSPLVFLNLTNLADGNQTLRDLAVKLNRHLLLLTQSVLPYIHQGLIKLVEVDDLRLPKQVATAPNPQPLAIKPPVSLAQPKPIQPLVAYIDDSRIDSQTMDYILKGAGYRFISIQESVNALPTLLEHKPNLIFLDLVMPVANGYEICSQVRRVSAFKETPVIILTSSDGIVDRVRAKMVGASGFLAKPIDQQKVVAVLQRYLPGLAPLQSSQGQTSIRPQRVPEGADLRLSGITHLPPKSPNSGGL